jgi:hypothetical protein
VQAQALLFDKYIFSMSTMIQTKAQPPPLHKLLLKSTTSLNRDEKIPVVRHVIKDVDIEQIEGEQLEPLELDRIIKLFVDPHSVIYLSRNFIIRVHHSTRKNSLFTDHPGRPALA